MTGAGWLALAVAAALGGGGGVPAVVRPRLDVLALRSRLAPAATVRRRRPAAVFARALAPGLRGRRAAARRQELRAALAALTAELTAGGRPAAAMTAAAAAAPAYSPLFERAAATAAAGGEVADDLASDDATAGLACAWRLAERTGVAPAAVVDRVAADLDAAEEHRRALGVALAGPRSSAVVLAGLPVVGLLLGTAMGGHPVAFLFGTPAGAAVGALGVGLDVAGLLWIDRILRRAAR